ncbi:MAG: S8 family serine peptidase [Verrucomicrobia bacterium]|nr:S8 family serine peptidase [Verrucomicrobiota bacterium]MBI3867280.1 S8 family serine peptidase [Verrucomicrobiota bacterium]
MQLIHPDQAAPFFTQQAIKDWKPLKHNSAWFEVAIKDPEAALLICQRWETNSLVRRCEPLLARQRERKSLPNDPLFPRQWHLRNTGQSGGTAGVDLQCEAAWILTHGEGVVVGVLDDGLQMTHPDLAPNISTEIPGHDWNQDDNDPSPGNLDVDIHGTQVAGLIGARDNNGIGIVGVASRSLLVGLRLIGGPTTDVMEAEAIAYRNDLIAIKNASWGAPDGTGLLEGIGTLAASALKDAVEHGRGGLGTLLVFAGGNGRRVGDNANYDGYANSPYTLAVGAVDHNGGQASYGEPGACLLVSAPSGSAGLPRLTTTDLVGVDGADSGDYSTNFNGTSASTPLASGVLAMMLAANPGLSWRDAEEIVIRTATQNAADDADWSTNSAGLRFNHKFGAGLINAGAAVQTALNWRSLGPMTNVQAEWSQPEPGVSIPDNKSEGITLSLPVHSKRFRVEHVTLQARMQHDYWGDLSIVLKSPGGMKSVLAEPHTPAVDTLINWTFSSVRHWGELADGEWTVQISDQRFLNKGHVSYLKLELLGSQIPPLRPTLAVRPTATGHLITLFGEAGQRYELQRSMDLNTWERVTELTATEQETSYLDTDTSSPRRFYRAEVLQ